MEKWYIVSPSLKKALKRLIMEKEMKVAILFNLFLIALLLFMSVFIGCRDAYIGGYSLSPDTTTHNSTIFNEIVDSDSSVHWYVKVYDGELWCYYHNRYEVVKRVRR